MDEIAGDLCSRLDVIGVFLIIFYCRHWPISSAVIRRAAISFQSIKYQFLPKAITPPCACRFRSNRPLRPRKRGLNGRVSLLEHHSVGFVDRIAGGVPSPANFGCVLADKGVEANGVTWCMSCLSFIEVIAGKIASCPAFSANWWIAVCRRLWR